METPFGNMHVAIQGDRAKPAILTFHDIGLNREYLHRHCFVSFIVLSVLHQRFCIVMYSMRLYFDM